MAGWLVEWMSGWLVLMGSGRFMGDRWTKVVRRAVILVLFVVVA